MTVPAFLEDRRLQLLVFAGKGGVGKTTCATAAALHLAQRSPASSFLLVSTDPAHSLADSLADLVPPGNLKVLELDARACLTTFKKKHNDELREIAARGTFLDDEEINRFLDLSLPGLDELMAFLEIAGWVENRRYHCIVADTAPSGHTLRLLAMPEFLRKWLDMLDTMLAKHRYMKLVFAHSDRRDELDAFLDDLAGAVKQMEGLLQDSLRCRFVPVMLAEAMSIRETVSMVKEAGRLKLPMTDIVINRLYPDNSCAVCRDERLRQIRELRDLFGQTHLSRFALWTIPLYAEEVRGRKALESFWNQVGIITKAPGAASPPSAALLRRVEAGDRCALPNTTLLIFAGKGGVGKTTLACATALQMARASGDKRVLLFSTGSAHSLSGCLEMEIDSRPKVVISGLTAMEVDAEEEFEALKTQYAGDIGKFLESMSSQFDLTFDREVIERILDLSPPGLDEVMALTRVTALLASGNYDVLVLDSASTGHLIRLLELPEIIDQWLKIFFDLFLKYQQIFRLTKFSQELVTVSKNLKRLKQSLNDPATAALYAVSIPTDMAYEETRDLLAACKRLGIGVARLFLNLFTPPSDCGLCSALYRRESLVRDKFQQSLPGNDFTLVYRCGETRGLRRLGELGQALYQSADVESRVYAHWRQHGKPASPGLGTIPGR
jgi:arsenite-transporting ATPase